jgi:hypothetical protein
MQIFKNRVLTNLYTFMHVLIFIIFNHILHFFCSSKRNEAKKRRPEMITSAFFSACYTVAIALPHHEKGCKFAPFPVCPLTPGIRFAL